MKLRIIQPGKEDRMITVDGAEASIGRRPDCDVTVEDRHVSGRHVKLLSGWVVIDLDSTNGTFVEGQRVRGAALVKNGTFQLGGEKGDVTVRIEDPSVASDDSFLGTIAVRSRDGLENEKQRNAELVAEIERLKEELNKAIFDPEELPLVRTLREEGAALKEDKERLRERAEALEADLADRKVAAEAAAQARDTQVRKVEEELATALRRKEEVQARLVELDKRLPELEEARVGLQLRVDEIGAQLSEKQADFERVRAERDNLKSALAENETPPNSTADSGVKKLSPTTLPFEEDGETGIMLFLRRLVEQDLDQYPPSSEPDPAHFLTLELFRFMRQQERMVTHLLGSTEAPLDPGTTVPGRQGRARELIAATIDAPHDRAPRRDLLGYLHDMQRWVGTSLKAYPMAAGRLVEELRAELTEEGLTKNNPVPTMKRLAGQVEAELWQRATSHLRELTPSTVDLRLRVLVQAGAAELMKEKG